MAKKTEIKVEEKLERIYIINLRDQVSVVPRYKRTPKAIKTIKEFIAKNMKVKDRDLNLVKIDKYLNHEMWRRGIKNPPMKVKVKAIKVNEIVTVELAEMMESTKFKKLREEKINKTASEKAPKKVKEEVKEKDKDKDGVEDKKETQEKEKTSAIAEQQIEKSIAKELKHETKNPKGNEKGHSKGQKGY